MSRVLLQLPALFAVSAFVVMVIVGAARICS